MSEQVQRPAHGHGGDGGPPVGDGLLVRFASRVGDLGSPFYAEERQRDVWNEASAVGYQLMTWLGLVAATAAVWVGGTTALPYALLLLGVVGIGSWVTLGYAGALGVDPVQAEGASIRRWRMVLLVLLLAAFVGGALRASPGSGFLDGAAWGALAGAVLGLAALASSRWRVHRRRGPVEA